MDSFMTLTLHPFGVRVRVRYLTNIPPNNLNSQQIIKMQQTFKVRHKLTHNCANFTHIFVVKL